MQKIAPFILLFILTVFSCRKPPEYSNIPEIKFKQIQRFKVDQNIDSIMIEISFKDGNGDLGITEAQSEHSKYNKFRDTISDINIETGDTTDIYVYRNFKLKAFKKNQATGEFDPIVFNSPIDGRFDPLFNGGAPSPIDGTLRHGFIQSTFSGNNQILKPFDEVRYEVYIYDRENNKSNTIVTDPIILFQN